MGINQTRNGIPASGNGDRPFDRLESKMPVHDEKIQTFTVWKDGRVEVEQNGLSCRFRQRVSPAPASVRTEAERLPKIGREAGRICGDNTRIRAQAGVTLRRWTPTSTIHTQYTTIRPRWMSPVNSASRCHARAVATVKPRPTIAVRML